MQPTVTPSSALTVRAQHVVLAQRRLVRGEERAIVHAIADQLQAGNVELDLCGVEQIDAAGITALIELYTLAHDLRHSLTIVSTSRHVKEILTLVRLEPLLTSHIVAEEPQSGLHSESAAA